MTENKMTGIKVLYAEDDLLTRLEVKEKLETRGAVVIEAGDGWEAIEKYRQCNPDVVILDVDMPRCTGLEVLQLIRVEDLKTPVIIYSSLAGEEDLKAGFSIGAKVYIIKNYSVDVLLMQVERLIYKENTECISLALGITYNFFKNELKIKERSEKLSSLESKVFAVLCKNKNKLSRRDILLQAGWNSTGYNLDAQLNKVVSKLKLLLRDVDAVEIVLDKGNGYRLMVSGE